MSNPYEPPRTFELAEAGDGTNGKAVTSLILGLISIVTCLIPLIGLPTTIAGLVFGIKGLGPRRRGTAIAGIVLSTIFLFATILNAAAGIYLAMNGRHDLVNRLGLDPTKSGANPPVAPATPR